MKSEAFQQSEGQYDLFPEELELKKIMAEMRKEKAYQNLPLNDPALKQMAELRLANRKSGQPSVEHRDHYIDDIDH